MSIISCQDGPWGEVRCTSHPDPDSALFIDGKRVAGNGTATEQAVPYHDHFDQLFLAVDIGLEAVAVITVAALRFARELSPEARRRRVGRAASRRGGA